MSTDALIARRAEQLTAYQSSAYAERYRAFMADVRTTLGAHNIRGAEELERVIAQTLARLMAYKDEYEVARLYASPRFKAQLRDQFSGDFKLTFHLSPPMLPWKDATGRPRKYTFSGWFMLMFVVLAWLRILRGTALDVFGYTAERRMERRLIAEYRELVGTLLTRLEPKNLAAAIALAREASEIRGFGLVKQASEAAYRARLKTLWDAFEQASAATADAAGRRMLPVIERSA
jgi:indolepyruvate ferredoxin oxidoreductase